MGGAPKFHDKECGYKEWGVGAKWYILSLREKIKENSRPFIPFASNNQYSSDINYESIK